MADSDKKDEAGTGPGPEEKPGTGTGGTILEGSDPGTGFVLIEDGLPPLTDLNADDPTKTGLPLEGEGDPIPVPRSAEDERQDLIARAVELAEDLFRRGPGMVDDINQAIRVGQQTLADIRNGALQAVQSVQQPIQDLRQLVDDGGVQAAGLQEKIGLADQYQQALERLEGNVKQTLDAYFETANERAGELRDLHQESARCAGELQDLIAQATTANQAADTIRKELTVEIGHLEKVKSSQVPLWVPVMAALAMAMSLGAIVFAALN